MTGRDILWAAAMAVLVGVLCGLVAGYAYGAPAWGAKSTGLIIGWVVYSRLAFRGPR